MATEDSIAPGKFATEADEATWWYQQREALTDQFLDAARAGRLRRGSTVLDRVRATKGSHLLTIALSSEDLAKIHLLAERQKVDDAAMAADLLSKALNAV